MKPSAYWWVYQAIGWSAFVIFWGYQASKGRASWWLLAVVVPVGLVLQYIRQRYYVPFVAGARARRKARKSLDQMPT